MPRSPATFFVFVLLLIFVPKGESPGGITVVDDLGRTVSLPAPAHRIVSLAPSVTESLFAIGAGGQVVGVTDYCDYPPEAAAKHHVGGMITPSIETIVELSPDLIVLSMEGNLREDFTRLEGLGVPMFVTNPRSLADIQRSLRTLGILTGREGRADTLIRAMSAREDSVRNLAGSDRKRTLLFVSLRPLIAAGRNTFINELLERAGGRNLAAASSATYPTYSREAVVAENPEVIIVTADVLPDARGLLSLFPEWSTLSAMRNRGIYSVNADIISRPGPRAVDGLLALFHILHGERQ